MNINCHENYDNCETNKSKITLRRSALNYIKVSFYCALLLIFLLFSESAQARVTCEATNVSSGNVLSLDVADMSCQSQNYTFRADTGARIGRYSNIFYFYK